MQLARPPLCHRGGGGAGGAHPPLLVQVLLQGPAGAFPCEILDRGARRGAPAPVGPQPGSRRVEDGANLEAGGVGERSGAGDSPRLAGFRLAVGAPATKLASSPSVVPPDLGQHAHRREGRVRA